MPSSWLACVAVAACFSRMPVLQRRRLPVSPLQPHSPPQPTAKTKSRQNNVCNTTKRLHTCCRRSSIRAVKMCILRRACPSCKAACVSSVSVTATAARSRSCSCRARDSSAEISASSFSNLRKQHNTNKSEGDSAMTQTMLITEQDCQRLTL